MEVKPMGFENLLPIFENRLLNDFILIIGNSDFLKSIEYGVYPPGTEKNKGFELPVITLEQYRMYPMALCKKTNELKEHLGYPDNFEGLIAIELINKNMVGYASLGLEYKPKKKNDKFKHFIRNNLYNMFGLLEWSINNQIRLPSLFETPEKFEERFKEKPNKKAQKKRKTLTKSIRHEVFKKDNYRCVECGATNKETTLHIDHIQPVSHGGSDELDNLQTLCQDCNLAKSNRFWKGGN